MESCPQSLTHFRASECWLFLVSPSQLCGTRDQEEKSVALDLWGSPPKKADLEVSSQEE